MSAAFLLLLAGLCVSAQAGAGAKADPEQAVRAAAADGRMAYRLTAPQELRALLGAPGERSTKRDGGMDVLSLRYGRVEATFAKMRNYTAPFVLYELKAGGEKLDIGANRRIVLRNQADLEKLDPFYGLQNVSLVNVDLANQRGLLDQMPFDTRTEWPPAESLPAGFAPAKLIEEGKNPGLGMRRLHERGIDGRGVAIAIIDQPLVRDHAEYGGEIVLYEEIDVEGVPPQMHGPAVASIAVGVKCGVAPGAALHYYAVPMWKWKSCKPYAGVIDRILERNKTLEDSKKVRAVSISTGMFPHWEDFSLWKAALAKAAKSGVLVVTCDTGEINYGTLQRIDGKDAEAPSNYARGKYCPADLVLLVPAGNRTIASYRGPADYTYDRTGGMSWGTPYMAGLAALAFQVKPGIATDTLVKLLLETAVKTDAGPVVNPAGFIEAVEKAASAP